jgi:hypothetical protein
MSIQNDDSPLGLDVELDAIAPKLSDIHGSRAEKNFKLEGLSTHTN